MRLSTSDQNAYHVFGGEKISVISTIIKWFRRQNAIIEEGYETICLVLIKINLKFFFKC